MTVNHSIKVFARLKKEHDSSKTVRYVINKSIDNNIFEDLIVRNPRHKSHGYKSYRFHKVFGEDSSQDELFEVVAKPLLNSALEGYNCTIFAYGQTGSGKTYTITGPPKKYSDRGIIPRSIQYIFERNEKVSPKPYVHISYMEIYNEIGYDLLHTRQINSASSLEELPRIIIMEDKKGEAHIRNLSVMPVATEEEAMKLLFLGDTNRTIAETSMNEFSSRSHCIFTIHITQGSGSTECLRYSKLHIIDLAGSERVSKSLTTGTALTEAKHINLSLHYLQQVIVALSERKRTHIPYRNSIVTYLLKDSLNGNCLSTMIANLAISKNNIEETISTCKYAYRVSLLKTEAVINEISDPKQEITCLKRRVAELEERLLHATGIQESVPLSSIDKSICSSQVEQFLRGGNMEVENDMSKIKCCFDILREKFILKTKCDKDEMVQKDKIKLEMNELQKIIAEKEDEIASLRRIIDNIPEQPVNPNRPRAENCDNLFDHKAKLVINNIHDLSSTQNLQTSEEHFTDGKYYSGGHNNLKELDMKLFKQFSSEQTADIEYYKNALESKLQMAKVCSDAINKCQSNILDLRAKLEKCHSSEKPYLIKGLEDQQNIYKKMLQTLREIKNETNHLQANLEQTEARAMQKFGLWSNRQLQESGSQKSLDSDPMENYNSRSHMCNQDYSCHEAINDACIDCKRNYSYLCESCIKPLHTAPTRNCSCCVRSGLTSQTNHFLQDEAGDHFKVNYPSNIYSTMNTAPTKGCLCCVRSGLTSQTNHFLQEEAGVHFKSNSLSDTRSTASHSSRHFSCNLSHVGENRNLACKMECDCTHMGYDDSERSNAEHALVQPVSCEEIPANHVYVDEDLNCEEGTTCMCSEAECSVLVADEQTSVTSNKESQSGAEAKAGKHEEYFLKGDSLAFREFMKTVALTGEPDVDECIFSFYRSKFS